MLTKALSPSDSRSQPSPDSHGIPWGYRPPIFAYDTQKLRVFARNGGASMAAAPVSGALTLYLDFINLFLALLHLFGDRRK